MNTKKNPRKATAEEETKPPQWHETTAFCKTNQTALQFISMHTANQMLPAIANLIVHLHRKVCGCSPGWNTVGSMLLPALYLCCTFTPNSKQQMQEK